jgi:hypothetical protein
VWDLRFIRENQKLKSLVNRVEKYVAIDLTVRRQEPFLSLMEGHIAGEEVLVRRMVYEIIEQLHFGDDIDLDKVLFFEAPSAGNRERRFMDRRLDDVLNVALKKPENVFVLTYDARSIEDDGYVFTVPLGAASDTVVAESAQKTLLWDLNVYDDQDQPKQWAITLGNVRDLQRLRQVLILKQVLELNKNLPLTLESFRPGVQLLFPSREDMRSRYHVIDHEVAQLFYETTFFYQASERVFNRMARRVDHLLGSGPSKR